MQQDEQAMEEMNTTNMWQDPEIEREMSDTANQMDSLDKSPESQQDDQAGNTTQAMDITYDHGQ